MRRTPFVLFAAVAASALALPAAHATHIFVTPVGEESSNVLNPQFNIEDCNDRDRELTFVWTVTVNALLRTLDQQVRATSSTASSCTFAGTEDCIELVGRQRWSAVQTYKTTTTMATLFPEGCGVTVVDGGIRGGGAGTRTVTLFIKDDDPLIVGGTAEEAAKGDIQIDFDFERPAAPAAAPTVTTGDTGLQVSVSGAVADAGTSKYRVYWSKNASVLTGTPSCSGDLDTSCIAGDTMTSTSTRINGLENGVTYHVAFSLLDDFDNESELSPTASGVPADIADFYEYYAAQGGQETGGFCFIATAAYGSYWHPLVGSLRKFRDRVLMQSELGRDLVSFYYSWSPALAEVVEDTPFLRFVFKTLLAPVAVAAWFLVETTWWEKLLLLALAYLALRFLRRARRALREGFRAGGLRRQRALLLALVALGVVAAAPAAFAESPRNFYLELKVGALAPTMDASYQKIFGDSSRVASGFELEWQILKDVGSFGVSGAMLFFQSVGKGLLATGATSAETTVLNVLPFQLNAVYRMDIPMRKYNVPLVPYAKFGFDYYLWWVLNGAGNVSSFTDTSGNRRRGVGGTFGVHFTIGLQFQLDVIDRRMQKSFDEEVGVNHSYIFAEIVFSKVNDFSDSSFNFSSNYFLAGLALEF